MSIPARNLTGQRIGHWTVLHEYQGPRKDRNRRWWCRCDCGTERAVLACMLLARQPTQSCGCAPRRQQTRRVPGTQIGDWLLISRHEGNRNRWLCQHTCGAQKLIYVYSTVHRCWVCQPRKEKQVAKRPVAFRFAPEADKALERLRDGGVLGANEAVEEAVACWATALEYAAQDVAQRFTRDEWCLVADVMNGTLFDPSWQGSFIAANVFDGHRLDGTGYRWLGGEGTELTGSAHRLDLGEQTAERAVVDAQVADLCRRLQGLSYPEARAVLSAVRWFWSRCEARIDPREDPWWLPAWRRQFDAAQKKEGT